MDQRTTCTRLIHGGEYDAALKRIRVTPARGKDRSAAEVELDFEVLDGCRDHMTLTYHGPDPELQLERMMEMANSAVTTSPQQRSQHLASLVGRRFRVIVVIDNNDYDDFNRLIKILDLSSETDSNSPQLE